MKEQSENNTVLLARSFFEESLAIQQLLKALPEGVDVAVSLENRIDLRLFLDEGTARLVEGPAQNADIKTCFYSEALRRLSETPSSNLLDLIREFSRETLSGQIKWTLQTDWQTMRKKGYMTSLRKLGPQAQGEILNLAVQVAGQAQFLFSAVAKGLKDTLKNRFGRQ